MDVKNKEVVLLQKKVERLETLVAQLFTRVDLLTRENRRNKSDINQLQKK